VDTIHTGPLPVGLPSLRQTGDGYDGFVIVPILGATTAVVIIDAQGNIVWYHSDARQLDFYRARLSVDGKSVLYNAAKISGEPSPASELVRVSLDGTPLGSIPIPLLAHDFVEHRGRHPGGDRVRGSPGRRRGARAWQQAGRGRARRNTADRLDQLELLRSRHRAGRRPGPGLERSRTRWITTPPRTRTTSACATSAASPR
jgi:hypothetical protein